MRKLLAFGFLFKLVFSCFLESHGRKQTPLKHRKLERFAEQKNPQNKTKKNSSRFTGIKRGHAEAHKATPKRQPSPTSVPAGLPLRCATLQLEEEP